ncbi:hypothetical protein PPL_06166 [Heterostelium album PN500]|uniref:Uncharacterized protein n=1 Tax=Heterostelium pallidum (strain ATCC 26659 / Pp 5 / PN500) TaxID=670386 RepID=D3BCE1_HETP5|nr:hypothetical protein PPL_06166 [Heterostelium album PN500]EFA80931.1 hypothetical protein PPL_06166 [Heterostelium album PN500]|eukprot:XP_020433049.1 hypothetical protein PPL_06166 [Heterostelium album PN500]
MSIAREKIGIGTTGNLCLARSDEAERRPALQCTASYQFAQQNGTALAQQRADQREQELREKLAGAERAAVEQREQRTATAEYLEQWESFGADILESIKHDSLYANYPNPFPLESLRKEFSKYINTLRYESGLANIRANMLQQLLDTVWRALKLPQSKLLRNLTSTDTKTFEDSKQQLFTLITETIKHYINRR